MKWIELFWKSYSLSARLEIPSFCEIGQVVIFFMIIPQQALICHCTYLNSYSQMFSFIFSSEVRLWFPNFPFFSDFKTRVLNLFLVSSCSLHFASMLWVSDCKNVIWGLGITKHYKALQSFSYTRWFKYDRDWFVCKQAALCSSCATLREWSHNLHPPSCSG